MIICFVFVCASAMHCGENMEYLPVGPAYQKTCMDILNNTISDNRTDESAEGCFCKAGFVLEEDRCIHEDKCGCLFEGEYFPVCIIDMSKCILYLTQNTKFITTVKPVLCRHSKIDKTKFLLINGS